MVMVEKVVCITKKNYNDIKNFLNLITFSNYSTLQISSMEGTEKVSALELSPGGM